MKNQLIIIVLVMVGLGNFNLCVASQGLSDLGEGAEEYNEEQCSICLDPLTEGTISRMFLCHKLHEACANQWAAAQIASDIDVTCPTCRSRMKGEKRTERRRMNYIGANLVRADLSGANLERVNLVHANLSRANLSRANLSRANCR